MYEVIKRWRRTHGNVLAQGGVKQSTGTLQQALKKAAALPQQKQDRLALLHSAELEPEQRWFEFLGLPDSEDLLERLADETLSHQWRKTLKDLDGVFADGKPSFSNSEERKAARKARRSRYTGESTHLPARNAVVLRIAGPFLPEQNRHQHRTFLLRLQRVHRASLQVEPGTWNQGPRLIIDEKSASAAETMHRNRTVNFMRRNLLAGAEIDSNRLERALFDQSGRT